MRAPAAMRICALTRSTAGHALRDRVFDLDARVDLDEIKFAGVSVLQELDRSGRAILDGASDLERRLAQRAALALGEERRRRTLHHLLVAPLHGAVALVEMNQIAVRVAQYLHFHVPRAPDELLEIHLVLAEGRLGLTPRGGHRRDELPVVFHDAHAAAAAAPARLEHDRKAHRMGHRENLLLLGRQRRRGRHHRDARARRKIARLDFVAQPAHGVGQRADEHDPGRRASLGELRAFRQESIARMHGVDARLGRDANDVGDVEIRLDRPLALADQIAFVGLGPVQRKAVFLRVDRDRANAELGRRTHHTNRDFAAIGDEHALDLVACGGMASSANDDSLARSHRPEERTARCLALAIHGGAGTLPRAEMSGDMERLYRAGLAEALKAGFSRARERRHRASTP